MKDHLGNKKESSTHLIEVLETDIFHELYKDGTIQLKVRYLLDVHGQETVMTMYPTSITTLIQCPNVNVNDQISMYVEIHDQVMACAEQRTIRDIIKEQLSPTYKM